MATAQLSSHPDDRNPSLEPLSPPFAPLDATAIAQLNRDLQQAIADLTPIDPRIGLLRFLGLGITFLSLVAWAWSLENIWAFTGVSALAGFTYCFWLFCNHDAAHHSLTGWVWFDELMPRLNSWPMFWPCSVYAELHRLHHGWNGLDLRDPERVEWTTAEYAAAPPWLQWYIRHQWPLDILVLGGLALILKTLIQGLRYQTIAPRLRRWVILDILGILSFHAVLGTIAAQQGQLGRYCLFWFVMERAIGLIVQTRDHLEHYGMWSPSGQTLSHRLTQLYACRNLNATTVTNWLMGGLPYHSIHHAFPQLQFHRLPLAFERIQTILTSYQQPALTQGQGYITETIGWVGKRHLIPQTMKRHDDRPT